ncbi:hypothetical protein M2260_000941 [Rhodococcus erythropolis]|nr:hypothetical protein [Rhodococcus erythropolis]
MMTAPFGIPALAAGPSAVTSMTVAPSALSCDGTVTPIMA